MLETKLMLGKRVTVKNEGSGDFNVSFIDVGRENEEGGKKKFHEQDSTGKGKLTIKWIICETV